MTVNIERCPQEIALFIAYNAVLQDDLAGKRPEHQSRYVAAATWEHRLECPRCRPALMEVYGVTVEKARARVERYRKRRLCETGGRIRSAMREAEDPVRPPDQWFRLSKHLFRHVLDCRPCLAAFEDDGVTADRIRRELDLDLEDGEGWKQ